MTARRWPAASAIASCRVVERGMCHAPALRWRQARLPNTELELPLLVKKEETKIELTTTFMISFRVGESTRNWHYWQIVVYQVEKWPLIFNFKCVLIEDSLLPSLNCQNRRSNRSQIRSRLELASVKLLQFIVQLMIFILASLIGWNGISVVSTQWH